MFSNRLLASLLLCALLAGHAEAARAPSPLPPGVVLPKDVKLPADVTVAAYLPANKREQRFYVSAGGFWAQPGKALEDSVSVALQGFFASSFLAAPDDARPHGLLLVLHPAVKAEGGSLQTTLAYKVYRGSEVVLEGRQVAAAPFGDLGSGGGFYKSSLRAAQLVMVDVLLKLRPDRTRFPDATAVRDFDPSLLVDRESPVATGTGFYINAAGQVMTAAHVIHDCVIVDVKRDGKAHPARVIASSHLLDLAVLDTGAPVQRFLPLRKGHEVVLGEPVTNVGFPLQKILAATPNLTRGNVSSRGALAGSVGQFQFSAPIQPGSSGGPVVSDGGELLGVTVGTLNAAGLVQSGALPQNVNFALDARYAAMFLRKHDVAFSEVEPNFKGDIRTGNEAALATVLSLSCYQ